MTKMTETQHLPLTSTITESFKKNIKKLKKVAKSFEKRNGQFVSLQRQMKDGICVPVKEKFKTS
jgi:hypothetical protein